MSVTKTIYKDNLLLNCNFNNISGDTINEISNYKNTGIIYSNSPTKGIISGRLGSSTDDYSTTCVFENTTGISLIDGSITFNFSVKINGNSGVDRYIFCKQNPNSNYKGITCRINNEGKLLVQIMDNYPSVWLEAKSTKSFTDNIRYDVFVIFDISTNNVSIIYNSIEDTVTYNAKSGNIINYYYDVQLYIKSYQLGQYLFWGNHIFDYLKIWDITIPIKEIKTLQNLKKA